MPNFDPTAVALRYGWMPESDEEGIRYLKALKVLLSVKGRMAEPEQRAFRKGLQHIGASAEVVQQIEAFEPRGVALASLLPSMTPGGLRARLLLRDAIEVSRTGGTYTEAHKSVVAQAARLLGVDDSSIKSIESLVELEHAVRQLRKVIFTKRS